MKKAKVLGLTSLPRELDVVCLDEVRRRIWAIEARVEIDPAIQVGGSADEQLAFTPITGGTISGPLLQGIVLSGGGDWSVKRPGAHHVEARYLVQASGGTVIDIVNRGYFRADASVERRIDAGEPVEPDEYYFRCAPVFRTEGAQHGWLTENQFVGDARVDGGDVVIRVFVVR